MTFRAKPVVRRFQRPSWDTRNRRNFYLNLGFGLAVVAAVVILGIAVAISYYNDHLATVGSVDGQSITKDDLRDRTAIETWRLQIAQRRVNTQAAAIAADFVYRLVWTGDLKKFATYFDLASGTTRSEYITPEGLRQALGQTRRFFHAPSAPPA